jgi:prephenate dehydratase
MKSPTLIAFMGPNSQTGTALREEASYIKVPNSNESFETLATRVQNEEILVVLPVWNSHESEITSSRVVELLIDGKAILHKLWPKKIEFECVSRVGVGKPIRTVISVPVAATQCSAFIKRIKAQFIEGGSTVQAYDRFSQDKTIDAVLCVPGTGKPPFTIINSDVSNDLNFTTFAVIGNIATRNWIKEWGLLEPLCRPSSCSYAAVELSLFSVASTEDQTIFFQELTSFAQKSLELPRIVFATRRNPDRCGLIIQSEFRKLPENILSDDGYSSEIRIRPHIGDCSEKYADRVHSFLKKKFPNALKHPFVKHVGTKPCFFACPAIGVLTHGYDVAIVEPVVRRYIAKWFQLIDDGLECTTLERKFFEKYRKAYYKSAENFFNFARV